MVTPQRQLTDRLARNRAIAYSSRTPQTAAIIVRYQGIDDGGYRANTLQGEAIRIRLQSDGVPTVGDEGIAVAGLGVFLAWF